MTTRNIIPQFQCHKELTGFIKLLAIQISADTCAELRFILVIFMTALKQLKISTCIFSIDLNYLPIKSQKTSSNILQTVILQSLTIHIKSRCFIRFFFDVFVGLELQDFLYKILERRSEDMKVKWMLMHEIISYLGMSRHYVGSQAHSVST